jgi:hypothetical protein
MPMARYFGASSSRVKMRNRRGRVPEDGDLALNERDCQNFSPLLNLKTAFHNLPPPVAQMNDRLITSCFASGGFAMHFRPLHDRVVVRRIEAEEKTSGGIIIPDTAKEKPQEGEVVAVGPARATRPVGSSSCRSRPGTASSSASGRGPRSRSVARICSS